VDNSRPGGVGGWLLVLCLWLIVLQPVSLGLIASNALSALQYRGLSLGLTLVLRVLVAGMGVAAGLALLTRREAALTFARWSLVAAAASDTLVYTTGFFPSNRFPGDTPLYVAGTLLFYGAWFAYLTRLEPNDQMTR
jgi:hypothetical protein